MSSYTAPPPTITEFASVLSEETGWYIFGTFMGIPADELDNIGLNYRTEGVMRCLIEMYKCIESRGLPLSWEHIVKSLRKMDNRSLADKIHSKYILPSLRLFPTSDQGCNVVISPNTDSTPKNGEQHSTQVRDDNDVSVVGESSIEAEAIEFVARDFISLSGKFTSLTAKIMKTIKQTNVDIDHLQHLIESQCGLEPLPKEKTTIDVVCRRLCQRCSILNFHVLTFLVENLFKRHQSLRKEIANYAKSVDRFKSSAKMIELVDLMQITPGKHKAVKMIVRKFWDEFTKKQFEITIHDILRVSYNLETQISVVIGGTRIAEEQVVDTFRNSREDPKEEKDEFHKLYQTDHEELASLVQKFSDFRKMFLNEHDYLRKELSSIKAAGEFVSKSEALNIEASSSHSAQFGSFVTTSEFSDFRKMCLNEHDYLRKELASIKAAGKFVSKSDASVIETSNFSAQFGSTVPITDLTHGAVIAEERLFVIGGENLVYHEWEEGGLVIHASENCVPPLSICEMRVSALVGGDFFFPDGHELVSAVYAVTFSQSLQQDVVLDLQHCVDLQIEEHTDCLSFAVASPLPSPSTYTFDSIKGGRFSVKDRYGSIETSESLCYCILMKECSLGKEKEDQNSNKRPSPHAGEEHKSYKEDDEAGNDESDPSSAGSEGGAMGGGRDDSDGSSDSSQGEQESSNNESEEKTSEDETGSVQDLDDEEEEEEEVKPKKGRSDVTELPIEVDNATQVQSLVSKPNGEPIGTCTLMYVCQTFTSKLDQINWDVEVVFAKELKVLTNYIKKNAKGDFDRRASRKFKFKKESLTLELIEKTPKSIEIVPDDDHPYEILHSAIDSYGVDKPPQPFTSKYMVAMKTSSDGILLPSFTLSVSDVEPPLRMNIGIRTKRANDFGSDDGDVTEPPRKRRCMDPDTTADSPLPHLDKKPSLKDAYNLLIGHSAQWDDIGLQLEVPFDDRDGWLNSTLTNRQCLQRVINKWLVSECHTPVTWGELIKILRSDALAFTATVRNIESFLRSETAKETYGRQKS